VASELLIQESSVGSISTRWMPRVFSSSIVAAAVGGHLTLALADQRPIFVVVEPARAACVYESARSGRPVKIEQGEPTVMAMPAGARTAQKVRLVFSSWTAKRSRSSAADHFGPMIAADLRKPSQATEMSCYPVA
jgi:hypothetical protein